MLCVQPCPFREIDTWEVCEVFTTQAGEGSLAQWLEESESQKVSGRERAWGLFSKHLLAQDPDRPLIHHVATPSWQARTCGPILQVGISRFIESKYLAQAQLERRAWT